MLHAAQSRRRFDQTASRLRSLVHPAFVGPDRLLVSERCDRIGRDEARRLTYREAALGEELGPLWATYWFRVELTIPPRWEGRPVDFVFDSGCEATLWRDGVVLQGLNGGGRAARTTARLTPAATADERIELEVELACNPWTGSPLPPIEGLEPEAIEGSRLGSAWAEVRQGPGPYEPAPARLREVGLALFDPEAWELRWDFEVLRRLEDEHARGLDPHFAGQAFAALDGFCDEWRAGDRASWARAREILAAPLSEPGPAHNHRVVAVGHTHLDTAWLWPFAETRRKFVRSVANQLALLDRYPEHRFTASSAQHYAWLAEDAPQLFARVREQVRAGRWSVVGGSWVEPDCNLPSGESLVRQFLHGQRYFEREFGVTCREHWGPDTFGHTGALPQILRAVGIERWLTQKLSWNQLTQPPHHSFVWEGIDGSAVLAHMPPTDTVNAEMTVRQIRDGVAAFKDADRSGLSLMIFGYGDGGGGPTPGMIEVARRVANLRGMPRVEIGTSEAFFELLEQDSERLATITGELYLEFHRGTYTSQLRTKQGNRRGELGLAEAEAAAAIATRLHGCAYPAAELERLWRTLLLHQFHDVLPGTSIAEVHRVAERDHAELAERAAALRDRALDALAGDGPNRVPVSLAPFPRTEVALDPDRGEPAVISAPAFGIGAVVAARDAVIAEQGEGGAIVLENEALRASFDRGGRITSLVERGGNREALGAAGNVFELYEDRPTSYDAWELEPYHRQTREPSPGAGSAEIAAAGPLRAEIVFEHEIGAHSHLRQSVRLDAGARRLEFATTIEWQERHRILKVLFPAAVRSDSATYETAFGVHQRSTRAGTPHEAARYEVPGHRFADLSEHGFGLAVLSDSTYGYSVSGSEIRLSLLRGPTDPDPGADLGTHRLGYALFAHQGGWREAGVTREARLFNAPLHWVQATPGAAASQGFAVVESGELVLDTIKRAEEGEALVLRLYEPHGGRGEARLRLGLPYSAARRADALERPRGPEIEVVDGALVLPYRPFELITLLVD